MQEFLQRKIKYDEQIELKRIEEKASSKVLQNANEIKSLRRDSDRRYKSVLVSESTKHDGKRGSQDGRVSDINKSVEKEMFFLPPLTRAKSPGAVMNDE
jgi:hypothetical protein